MTYDITCVASFAAIALSSVAIAGPSSHSLREDFNASALDLKTWCDCAINLDKSPLRFANDPDLPGNGYAEIPVDDYSLGGNECRKATECPPSVGLFSVLEADTASDALEDLGPSFATAFRLMSNITVAKNPYCTPAAMARAKAAPEHEEKDETKKDSLCIQRQELRLQSQFLHPVEEPHVYAFRFRMPQQPRDQQFSIRWVTAQWKQEPVNKGYKEANPDWDPSPYLAQRFDNGLMYVTVQSEFCRCLIASEPGIDSQKDDGPANICKSTRPATEGQKCEADLTLSFGKKGPLTSPVGRWTEMKYRAQAGFKTPATIEVWQDGRFIVRASGKIGYLPPDDKTAITKFKFGHYRDFIPIDDSMDVDWMTISRSTN